ncbi:MAG TPA: DNA (cytosine-5-)-methyltransferase [Thermoanaerobaculia bacterium]
MPAFPSKQLHLVGTKCSHAPALDGPYSTEPLQVAGLFAGIGGIELGLGRAEHESRLLCEIEPTAVAVLEQRFPNTKKQNDVRDLKAFPRGTELVSAGFPCQDLSQAGKTAGISGSRSGLIGEVFRLLEKRRVEWLLLENVSFMLQLGRGRALDVIMTELERLGYKWAYRVVNSRAFGVPQRRERIYILASLHHDPRNVLFVDDTPEPRDTRSFREVACGFYWTEGLRGLGWAVDSVPTLKGGSTIGIPSPPAIIFPSGDIAKPELRDAERMQGFEEDWTLPAETVSKRGARWKLVGNAVTVDAAVWIGKRLRNPGVYDPTGDAELASNEAWPVAAWNIGNGRHRAQLSTWPLNIAAEPLAAFLRHETQALSVKATAGFLSRAEVAKLRFPTGFLDAVRAHLARMRGESMRAII